MEIECIAKRVCDTDPVLMRAKLHLSQGPTEQLWLAKGGFLANGGRPASVALQEIEARTQQTRECYLEEEKERICQTCSFNDRLAVFTLAHMAH